MSDDRERRVRDRAYALWEREGRPAGRQDEHWFRASREIEAETLSAEPAPAAVEPAAAKAEAAKPVRRGRAAKPAFPKAAEPWPKDTGADDMETAATPPKVALPRKRGAVRAAPAKVAEPSARVGEKAAGTQRKAIKPKPAS
ncbi:DUF2934 domain-containing protein [Sphingomonas sanxanigenens]|nr:DUF2934 domain-containing protein [Sphingomonas sanxanigenens]